MSHKVNLVRVLTSATGNSTPITLGAAYSQLFMLPSEAGAMDGRVYTYLIVDGNNWELGNGAYTASGTSLARTTVIASRILGTLGTTRITLSGTAQVRFIESADDMDGVRGTRAVTGTTDTLNNSDLGYVVTYSNASAIAVSLAQASVSNLFMDGWAVWVQNTGVGTVTITPATSTIQGSATLALASGMGAMIWSDGANYRAFSFPVTKPLLAANNLADVASATTARSNVGASPLILSKTANYTVVSTDLGKLISTSIAQGSTLTLGSPAAATVGNGWSFFVENTGYGAVIFDPNGSETIDSASTLKVFKGQSFEIVSDGANWKTKGRQTVFTIASLSPSAAASANFTIPDGISLMELQIGGVFSSIASASLRLRSSQNGTTFDAGASDYVTANLFGATVSTVGYSATTASSEIPLSGSLINSAGGYNVNGSIKIRKMGGTLGVNSSITHYSNGASFYQILNSGGYRNGGTTPLAFQLLMDSGNLSADSLILQGIV